MEIAVTSSRPSIAHSFSVWMSETTGSNSSPRLSTRPASSAQTMNASSGSALCPTRIRTYATLPSYPRDVSRAPLSEAIQDYLKAIYKLQGDGDGSRVNVTAVARAQGVSAASASAMVKKLAALDLIDHEPYRSARLTDAGERVAVEVI